MGARNLKSNLMKKIISTRECTLLAEYSEYEPRYRAQCTKVIRLKLTMDPSTRIATMKISEQAIIDLTELMKQHGVNITFE